MVWMIMFPSSRLAAHWCCCHSTSALFLLVLLPQHIASIAMQPFLTAAAIALPVQLQAVLRCPCCRRAIRDATEKRERYNIGILIMCIAVVRTERIIGGGSCASQWWEPSRSSEASLLTTLS